MKPDLSPSFILAGNGVKTLGTSRYSASDSFHSLLRGVFGNGSSSAATSQDSLSSADTRAATLLRRVLAPAQYLAASAPARRIARALGLEARHHLELNTDALLPEHAGAAPSAFASPYDAAEAARQQRVGLVNLDSNRPAVRPHRPKLPQAQLPAPAPAALGDAQAGTQNATVKATNPKVDSAVNGTAAEGAAHVTSTGVRGASKGVKDADKGKTAAVMPTPA